MAADGNTQRASGDVERYQRGGILSPFFTGVASTAAGTAGVALLLYNGQGLLRTAGLLIGITIGALAAGVWAGDDSSRSTRPRITAVIAALLVAAVFAALWDVSIQLRDAFYGGSLAVLFVLALPAYAAGSAIGSLQRHIGGRRVSLQVLAGAAAGIALCTIFLIPRLEAWSVFFAAAVLLLPSAAMPAARDPQSGSEEGGVMQDRVAIVTGVGGTGQLGFAIAQRLAGAGARVVVTGMSEDIRSTAQLLGDRERVTGVRADLTREEDVEAVMDAARSFGRLDALVNVAGGLTVIDAIASSVPTA
jgi:hypothetical protein